MRFSFYSLWLIIKSFFRGRPMNLKEFVDICIDKAEQADDRGDKNEAIRLIQLAIKTMQDIANKLEKEKA